VRTVLGAWNAPYNYFFSNPPGREPPIVSSNTQSASITNIHKNYPIINSNGIVNWMCKISAPKTPFDGVDAILSSPILASGKRLAAFECWTKRSITTTGGVQLHHAAHFIALTVSFLFFEKALHVAAAPAVLWSCRSPPPLPAIA